MKRKYKQRTYKYKTYSKEVEQYMRSYYESLNEKDRRKYAWWEAMRLAYWWKKYIKTILEINRRTLNRWMAEFVEELNKTNIRNKWWWRKKFLDKNLEIYTIFEKTMEGHTAWDPMNPDTIRTDLNPKEIVNIFDKKHSLKISIYLVKKLLKHKWYKTRKTAKKKSMWATEFRNEQFENIKDKLKQAVEDWAGVFSMDVKKKKT